MGLVPERLKSLREKRGWSQRELARRCEFADSMIRKYENGTSDPSSAHLATLADQFNVSTDHLLGRDQTSALVDDAPSLTHQEKVLIGAFRSEGWRGILRLLEKQIVNE